jgi:tRNA modification GTPase
MPGTTRDWIEASVSIKGIPLRLADTAGLRDTSSGTDEAEIQGIERSINLVKEADIIFYIVDACAGLCKEDKNFLLDYSNTPLILIWNKIDLPEALPIPQKEKNGASFSIVPVSAVTGKGLEELCYSINNLLIQKNEKISLVNESIAGLGTRRQKELTEKTISSLEEALGTNESLDLIAPLLRESLNALGEITGEISTADILEKMFSRFCLGK